MAESFVRLRAPPSYYFQFPPSSEPQTLYPAPTDHSLARPFNISPELYNQLLDVKVPITIATVYATVITLLNIVNRRRGNKPWAFSQTRVFFILMIAHNILLAVYSGWTFIGMMNAIKETWPGWKGSGSLAEAVDAFCKISGPRGLGDAAWWNQNNGSWTVGNPAIKLLGGKPDGTDVGRLWNEGLAFYGWLFYLSKYYEVIDTLIIIAKGKRSSFLQTYHHAGAMVCMWAGIRYMSPPIWMFVCVNSGIHALMYSYYTLSALGFRIPGLFKRTLTTMQITQFVVGFTYAVIHLFVAYRVPVHVPYVFFHNLSTALPSATSSVAAVASTANVGSWVKKAVLRAVSNEGLSENVRNNNGNLFGLEGQKAAQIELADITKAREEIRYRIEYAEANCIDTSGQAFAIMLNALYLLPLTMLFVRFFIRSYLRRTSGTAHPARSRSFGKSSYVAAKNVEREVFKAMSRDRGSAYNSTSNSDTEIVSPADSEFSEEKQKPEPRLGEEAESMDEKQAAVSKPGEPADSTHKKQDYLSESEEVADSISKKVGHKASEAKKITQERAQHVRREISESIDKLENFDDLSEEAKEIVARVTQSSKEGAANLANLTEEKAQKVVQELREAASSIITQKSDNKESKPEAKSWAQVASKDDSKDDSKPVKDEDGELAAEKTEKKKKNGSKEAKKDQETAEVESSSSTDAIEGEQVEEITTERTEESAASAYEATIDEITTAEEKQEEAKMQPDAVNQSK